MQRSGAIPEEQPTPSAASGKLSSSCSVSRSVVLTATPPAIPPRDTVTSPRVVSDASADNHSLSPNSSSSSLPNFASADQFEDAPEEQRNGPTTIEKANFLGRAQPASALVREDTSPLDALALACSAAEHSVRENVAVTDAGAPSPEAGATIGSSPPSIVSTELGATTSADQISHNDVLCGRGGLTNHHPGNVFFRRMVRLKQEAYLRATKRDKASVAREIVDTIRNLTPPGRFLKKDTANPGQWVEIGNRKAREKTSQALREGAPELREELLEGNQQHTAEGGYANRMFTGQPSPDLAAVMPRARIVSSDSAAPGTNPFPQEAMCPQEQQSQHQAQPAHPHYIAQEEPTAMETTVPGSWRTAPAGGKRKLDQSHPASPCAVREDICVSSDEDERKCGSSPHGEETPGSPSKKGGPRLRLLKARMMDYV